MTMAEHASPSSMKLLFTLLSVFAFTGALAAQSVVVTPRKTTYTRPKPIADFKKTFTVTYPKVKAATPALSRKIESEISYQKVLDLNVKDEITEVQWLEEADFEVLYNARGLLCVSLFISGSGAYSSGTSKAVVVDVKRGVRVTAATAFDDRTSLVNAVKNKQKVEIENAIVELRKDPDKGDQDPADLFKEIEFKLEDLDHFSIDDTGVTFIFDYGFPHVIQAWQPEGRFKFSWTEIAQLVKPNGPFAKFLIK